MKWAAGTERIMCFDEANGVLVSVEYPRGDHPYPPEISRIEYGAFNSVGGKLVPYEIRALKDGKVIAAVKVVEITKITEENSALFNVPVNAEFWAQCDDMQEPEVVDRTQPVYPLSARANYEQGRVILYAVIEADGSLSHITIIQRATPALEAAAVEAISSLALQAGRVWADSDSPGNLNPSGFLASALKLNTRHSLKRCILPALSFKCPGKSGNRTSIPLFVSLASPLPCGAEAPTS